MAGRDQLTARQLIDAMKGSGGIITTIANRVQCDWHTAKKYIEKYPTVKAAYEDECNKGLDLAESVVIQNIRIAARQAQDAVEPVNAVDAKWYLNMKGSSRGYAPTTRAEIAGPGGGPIETKSETDVTIDASDELREFIEALHDAGLITGTEDDALRDAPTDTETAPVSAAE